VELMLKGKKSLLAFCVLLAGSVGDAFACPACAGNLPPDEDGSSRTASQWAYNLSIGMLLGTPVCLVGGIGLLARKQIRHLESGRDQPRPTL
jgi:hypothetical protein